MFIMPEPVCMMATEISETRTEKLSFPTGLLSSLFSVVLPQRALTPSTATRRWKMPEELCLFSSLSTIPTASVAFLTRVMPCSKGRQWLTVLSVRGLPGFGTAHRVFIPVRLLLPKGCLSQCFLVYSRHTSLEFLSKNKQNKKTKVATQLKDELIP